MNITTKYSPGDTVWIFKDNRAVESMVCCVNIHISLSLGRSLDYSLSELPLALRYQESQLFPDKPSLLASL